VPTLDWGDFGNDDIFIMYFPVNNEKLQIDHIVVSKYGVFVVETKNIKGWIPVFRKLNNGLQ